MACRAYFQNGSVYQEKLHELRRDEEFQALFKCQELFREIPVEVIERRVIYEKNNTVEANKNFDRR